MVEVNCPDCGFEVHTFTDGEVCLECGCDVSRQAERASPFGF